MLLLLWTISAPEAATANDLATAMAVPSADLVSTTIIGNASAYDALSNLGILNPTEGADLAYLYTGRVGVNPETGTDLPPMGSQLGDKVTFTLTFSVPATANSLSFDFYFLSAEYPEFVGTQYNDTFETNVTGTAWSGNAAVDGAGNDITINSALFSVTNPADLQGTGFNNTGGGTGWMTTLVPADPLDTLTLEFVIWDEADGIYDSAVMLDNFTWSEDEVDVPVIVEDLEIDYLSPKRGSIDGNESTTIYGTGFNETCKAFFDGVEAPTTYVDSYTMTAVPLAHAAGLVDLEVDCTGSQGDLVGAYTYYDSEAGEDEPLIDTVSPYDVEVDGGEEITVTGEGFHEDLVATLDGETLDVGWIDSATFTFTTPAHEEGLADLRVVNPNGLENTLSGALLFVDTPTWPLEDTGLADTGENEESKGGSASTGCTTLPSRAGWIWVALSAVALVNRRRRR